MGWKRWAPRTRIPAPELQAYLQDQVVTQFPTASARETSIGDDAKTGMISWLDIPGQFDYFDGNDWSPLTELLITDTSQLPATGKRGAVARNLVTGQRWEWRSVGGVAQWTWPREAQGELTRVDFAPTAPVVLATGVGPLTALSTEFFDIAAGRTIEVKITGTLTATTAGNYAVILQALGAERRIPVNLPAGSVPTYFEGSWTIDVGTFVPNHKVSVAGGPLSGSGTVSFSAPGLDIPHQLMVDDKGAMSGRSYRLQQ